MLDVFEHGKMLACSARALQLGHGPSLAGQRRRVAGNRDRTHGETTEPAKVARYPGEAWWPAQR